MVHRDFRHLADIYEYLIDTEIGIIAGVFELPRYPGTPDFFHFSAYGCNTKALVGHKNFNNTGGASISRDLAAAKAVGEAVERYCSAIYAYDELALTSRAKAPFHCVQPDVFALYSPAQYEEPGFPWAPFDDYSPVRWTPAHDPLNGEVIHVPAAMVFIPYYYHAGEAPIVQPISTGLACHTSFAQAAVGGLCEVIERDALTIFWQAMVSPPQILVETLSEANYDRAARFEAVGYRVTLLDITTDIGVPVVMAVARTEAGELPALAFAAAAALDAEEAVAKALDELAHTRRYCHAITVSSGCLVWHLPRPRTRMWPIKSHTSIFGLTTPMLLSPTLPLPLRSDGSSRACLHLHLRLAARRPISWRSAAGLKRSVAGRSSQT